MKARIASEVHDDEIASDIANAIADAWKLYRAKAFFFNSRLVTFNTVAGQEWYGGAAHADIPNLVAIQSLKVGASGVREDLVVYDPGVIESLQDGNITGEPYGFAYEQQQIRLIGIPDAVYPIRARWVYRLDLPADSASNAWTDDAEILIRNCAKRHLGLGVLEDEALAARAESLERAAFNALMRESRTRRSNGMLRTELAGMTGGSRFNVYRGA